MLEFSYDFNKEYAGEMIKKILYTFLLFNFGLFAAFAQNGSVKTQKMAADNKLNQSEFSEVPETREDVDSLLDASWENRNTNLKKALEDATLGLRSSKMIGYKEGIARSHYLLGIAKQRTGGHEEALEHYLTALEMEMEFGNKKRTGKVLNGIAILYYRQNNYELATKYFQRSIELMKETGDIERVGITMANIGLIYYKQGLYQKSLDQYYRALQIFKDSTQNELARHVTFSNMGNTLVALGEYDEAEEYHLKALQYFDRNGLVRNQSEVNLNLSKLYFNTEQNDDSVLEYAQKSLEQAKSINYKETVVSAYEHLADVYENRNDYRQAYYLFKQYKDVQDSLLNIERMAKIEEMQTRFDVEQKDREIELLNNEAALKEADISQQKLWRNFLFVALALFAIIGGLLYRYNSQKKRANYLLEKKNREIEQQNRQLVSLNEEKDKFLGMAAHDLRSPLSGIKSVTGLMESEPNMSQKELQGYVDIIGLSANRMLTLIDNLLDINAIENGSSRVNIESINLEKHVRQAVNNFEKLAEIKQIKLVTHFNFDSPLVMADGSAIQRVLENLLSNAIKYSPGGSTVSVAAAMRKNRMELSVKDNGPGIRSEEQQQLFQQYSRLSNKPTGNEGSTGLGLFIVKNLVEEMEGSIKCESEPGEGTEFIITLPVANIEKSVA